MQYTLDPPSCYVFIAITICMYIDLIFVDERIKLQRSVQGIFV